MGAFIGLLGLGLFFIALIIFIICLFGKKSKKKPGILMLVGIILFVLGLAMDSGNEEQKTSNNQSQEEATEEQSQENTKTDGAEIDQNKEKQNIDSSYVKIDELTIREDTYMYQLEGTVENISDYDLDNIYIELALYDKNNVKIDETNTAIFSGVKKNEKAKFTFDIIKNEEIDTYEITKISMTYKNSFDLKDKKEVCPEISGVFETKHLEDTKSITENMEYDNIVIQCAQTLVYETLKAPATAQWGDAEIIDKDEYGRYLIEVVVDSENGFGALMRSHVIVVLQSVQEDGSFHYNEFYAYDDYEAEYERETVIETLKSMNDWNEPKEK